jgi:hypothetical protein
LLLVPKQGRSFNGSGSRVRITAEKFQLAWNAERTVRSSRFSRIAILEAMEILDGSLCAWLEDLEPRAERGAG